MSSAKNNDCPDLTPNTECNDSCRPDYEPQEEWCKAFNKRTLEQQRMSATKAKEEEEYCSSSVTRDAQDLQQHQMIIAEVFCVTRD